MEFNIILENIIKEEIIRTKQLLQMRIYNKVCELNITGYITKEPVKFINRLESEYREFNIGDTWGELFDCAWFNLSGKINDDLRKSDLYLKLDVSGEACLYDESGTPIKGFTNGSSVFDRKHGEPGKKYYKINDFIDKDGSIDLYVEAGCNDLFGNLKDNGKIIYCEIVERNDKIRELFYDYEVLLGLLETTENNTAINKELFERLYFIHKQVLYEEDEWIEKCLKITKQLLSEKSTNKLEVSALGHAHIDLAWLWPIRETKRKIGRTFANVVSLFEEYPEFKFGASQPQLFEWLKEDYPLLFNKIKKYVKEGRFEVQGGMWVECDTNITGEESLVRQILYGVRYFQDEFGVRVKNVWLPDVFGYNASLPQIMKKAGLDYFMTIKLSWSLVNQFPYHTFNWVGIDGSSILCHMPPEGNYNSSITPKVLKQIESNYKEKDISKNALALFGIGDGGGGPGREHLERIRRSKDLALLPKISIDTGKEFFDKLDNGSKFPTWSGELYLENHRGTYTSQGKIKYYNRKLENKLKTVETMLIQLEKYDQFKASLEKIWKEILLYQFHDILPGTSIKRVYDECLVRYKDIDKQLDSILFEITNESYLDDFDNNMLTYNPLEKDINIIKKFGNKYLDLDVKSQSTEIINKNVYGLKPKLDNYDFDGIVETDIFTIKIDINSGNILSVFDKEIQKEMIDNKQGNLLSVYKDYGDAWNIQHHYREQKSSTMSLVDINYKNYDKIHEVTLNYQYQNSSLSQIITITEGSRLIDFDNCLDWKDLNRMLRVSFPINVKADDAICDIQFGSIKRSLNNNTSWDKAKFEVAAHNWVDINDGAHGVALINDCKYGHYLKDNILDLNLIRSTNYPAINGDISNNNKIKYALYIHKGDHIKADIDSIAMRFNSFIPILTNNTNFSISEPLFSINASNIKYSTIKQAEDSKDIIIRLYENSGCYTSTIFSTNKAISEIIEVNLLEEEVSLISNINKVQLIFKPFEIKTIKLIKDYKV